MESARPPSPEAVLVQLAVRGSLLLAAFAGAFAAWQALPARAPGRPSGLPAGELAAAAGWSLGVLAAAVAVGTLAGLVLGALGALADQAERRRPWTAGIVKAAGRLAQMPWVALSPATLAILLALRVGVGGGATPAVLLVTLVGLPATMVAAAVYDQVRRNAWRAATGAALAALGRALVAAAGALLVTEPFVNAPGVGRLLFDVLVRGGGLGPLAAALLVIALAGSAAALVGDALTALWSPRAALARSEPAAQRAWLTVTLALLALPALLFLVSQVAAASGPPRLDFTALEAPPSLSHPLGTDRLGRDVLGLGLLGLRSSFRDALTAAVLAAACGSAWGGAAAFVARFGRPGAVVADVLVAPAWTVALVPLLPAVAILAAGGSRQVFVPALAVALVARVALGVRDMGETGTSPALQARASVGMLLLCLGVALVAGVGLDAIGVGGRPPEPTLGLVLADGISQSTGSDGGAVASAAWLCALCAGPCLWAGWTLLRPFRRAQAWARLTA
jgi:ABC-type dipeptide/oligopeptide/nickel transport system permease subunit